MVTHHNFPARKLGTVFFPIVGAQQTGQCKVNAWQGKMVPFLGLKKVLANQYVPNQTKAGKEKCAQQECERPILHARTWTMKLQKHCRKRPILWSWSQSRTPTWQKTNSYFLRILHYYHIIIGIITVIITTIIIEGYYLYYHFFYIYKFYCKKLFCTLLSPLIGFEFEATYTKQFFPNR